MIGQSGGEGSGKKKRRSDVRQLLLAHATTWVIGITLLLR